MRSQINHKEVGNEPPQEEDVGLDPPQEDVGLEPPQKEDVGIDPPQVEDVDLGRSTMLQSMCLSSLSQCATDSELKLPILCCKL